MNKIDDTELEEELRDDVHDLDPGKAAVNEINKTENEMNQMFVELNELEERIKGNKDLKEMQTLME